jgi:hypothetical protein
VWQGAALSADAGKISPVLRSGVTRRQVREDRRHGNHASAIEPGGWRISDHPLPIAPIRSARWGVW